jgi:hypothetical protein
MGTVPVPGYGDSELCQLRLIEIDTGKTVVLDIAEPLRHQCSQPSSEFTIRIDINSTPPQDRVGGLYRVAFGAEGTVSNFENAGRLRTRTVLPGSFHVA